MPRIQVKDHSASQAVINPSQDANGTKPKAASASEPVKGQRRPSSRSSDIALLFAHDIEPVRSAKPRAAMGIALYRSQTEALVSISEVPPSGIVTTTATFAVGRPEPGLAAKGPEIRPFSEWDAQACLNHDDKAIKQDSALDLNDAEEVVKRAWLLNHLLAALDNADTAGTLDLLDTIPTTVHRFDLYFPPAPIVLSAPVELKYPQLVELATLFDSSHKTLSTLRLLMLLTDCQDRLETQHQLTARFETVPDEQIDQKFAPELQDLCFALRDIPEFDLLKERQDPAAANPVKDLTALIMKTMLLKGRDLVMELATQPFANLRMLQAKCSILALVDGGKNDVIIAFRKKVETARELQKNASAQLREQLLQRTVDKKWVAALALIEHAKQTTTLPIDYVSAGASWDEVRTMHSNIRNVYTYYVEQLAGDFRVEQAALDWVAQQIRSTTQLPH